MAKRIVCTSCGGEDVLRDAFTKWDIEKQEWVLSTVYDDTFCETCEESCTVSEETVQ